MTTSELQMTAAIFQAGFLAGAIVAFLLVTSGIKALLWRRWGGDGESCSPLSRNRIK